MNINFTDIFIRKPVLATTVSLLLLLIGLICYSKLSIRQFPKLDANVISITTNYSGANANVVESFITNPIENAIAGVDGIDYITSESSSGYSKVTLNLKLNADINAAMVDANSDLSSVLKTLPQGINDPVIRKVDPSSSADMIISFTSASMSTEAITDYLVRVVQPQISNITGVGSASVMGMRTYAMRIWLDPKRMSALGVTPTDVQNVLNNNNVQTQAGEIDRNSQIISINAKTDLDTPEEFNNLVIKQNEGKLVRLKDIGDAVLGAADDSVSMVVDDKETVGMSVTAKPTANPLEVAQAVKKALALIQPTLPLGMHFDIPHDSSLYIQDSITEVKHTLLASTAVVILIIFLFIGSARSVFIPLVTIPLSLVGACGLMYMMNYSINTLTLLAFVLAIGLVVDDAIVVLENIHRHIEAGMNAFSAAMVGAKEIGFAVIGMTITLAAVYAPIGFTSGLTGALFREFAFTLAGAVIVSGFIALTLSPMMCSKIMKPHQHRHGFIVWIDNMLLNVTEKYFVLLQKALQARPIVLMITATVLICGFIFFIPLKMKSTLAPDEDQGIFMGMITAPTAANIEYTAHYTRILEQLFKKQPEISSYVMINGIPNGQNSAMTFVKLKDWSERKRNASQLIQALMPQALAIPGITAMLFNPPSLPGSRQIYPLEFVLKTTGSYQDLNAKVNQLIAIASKNPGFLRITTDLKLNKPELEVKINRDKAAALGVSMSDISSALNIAFGTPQVTNFIKNGLTYEVIPQVDEHFRNNPDNLNLINVKTLDGKSIPLSTIVSFDNMVSPNSLNHFQQQRSATIDAVLAKQYSMGEAVRYLEHLAKQMMTPQMSFDFSGSTRQFVNESSSMAMVFVFALIFIFLVLSGQFESFRDPLIVMFSVPLSLVGALATLFFTGGSLNIYTEIGLVTLIGLISKHGILIVEFANQLQLSENVSRQIAVARAASIRFRPIVMTTAAMILGAVPLVLAGGAGAAARQQMGWVIIGGMLFGTVFTLFVVPTMYSFLASKKIFKPETIAESLPIPDADLTM